MTSTTLPETVRIAAATAHDKKAFDIVVLDLRTRGAFTDHFVLCSGRSTRQVKAIVDAVTEQLREAGCRPSLVEGYDRGEWVLIDCFDLVIHVFTEETRHFYDLERLWGNAERLEYPLHDAEPGKESAPQDGDDS